MKTKLILMLALLTTIMMLQGCCDDCVPDKAKTKVISNDFTFRAKNLSVDNGKLSAMSGSVTTSVTWTVNIVKDGQTISVSNSSKSDELPVLAGNEIEIRFEPSRAEETEAFFTMPDGSVHCASAESPSFIWTVPSDFTPGTEIKGESHYETKDYIYDMHGVITLVELK